MPHPSKRFDIGALNHFQKEEDDKALRCIAWDLSSLKNLA